MATTVRIDGWPVAPGTANAFLNRLKPAFEKAFPGVTLHVYSGYRSYEDQVKIFTERYRRGAHSPFGDYRYWNGATWGRVSGAGTVAAPGTSNHQSGHALDIRDSGSNAGVTTAGNARSNWIRFNASKYGFNPAGYGFAEPWHIEFTGDAWAGGSGGGGNSSGGGSNDNYDYSDLENDMGAKDDLDFIKKQVGGSGTRKTSLRQDVDKLMTQVGGSDTRKTSLRQDVDALAAEIEWLKDQVGGSGDRKTSLRQDVDAVKKATGAK